jgi:RimJ/RimL family protein N-acetyltransferase
MRESARVPNDAATPTPNGPSPAVELREVRDEDLPELCAHQLDPEAARMADFPSRDPEAFAAHWAKTLADPANLPRAIWVDGLLVGNIGTFEHDGQREVGYWIGREHWGRGIASEAVAAMMRLDHHRPMHAGAAAHNLGSIRVLEKNGFVTEGVDPADGFMVLRLDAADVSAPMP